MINEDKIREACASDKEHGFKLLMENFQQPIYWHIRRLGFPTKMRRIYCKKYLSVSFVTLTGLGKRARWAHGCIGLQPMNVSVS